MAVLAVAAAISPGSVDARVLSVEGPIGPRAFGGALWIANQLALVAAILVILGGAGSLVTRFRHAHGIERQQLRWLALAATLTGPAMLATGVLVAVGDLRLAGWASVFGTVFLPLATGAVISATGSTSWTGSSAAPWPWPPSSSRPAGASSGLSTAASTAAATTPPGSSKGSGPTCATRSTWTP
jgi:hypothetical protein